ncbi:bifunctional phosphopantothenoylcysteine decarboxylase/phosphopantothenate--cysteine ligase CoaBC [Hathewaya histolytica]|uniref:Coenzyme A biosynthesis bifunctional protein CoaBC n=1 Tax=Hathewaya histolytica TaxID=1498 RepID=A0A4U9REC3_HATHI|nr:bifunctional phosphopantothenoylcysteine decarboxylase/phosphopantothenate--cysteine ligase CoaBC [Hathewaya histolytica]VTQ90162.1 phosphopantothenoylcysteine decarboxylase/phosphopantothenate--cysteine ligase [Hathewaya histolytica]
MSQNKCLVIGVCGGIAAYKSLDVISKLRKKDIDIHVIMTKSAKEFITPLSFQSISQNMVIHDMFEEPKAWEIQHISLAKKADLVAIIPATANIIGKVASGIADDMLSTTIMATKSPVIFAPAMNTNMYINPIVQNNIHKLKEFGYKFIEPQKGRLACGDHGIGKLADTEEIVEYIYSEMYPVKDLVGKKVLVTAGPTIGRIDPVRIFTNRSSGKMGYAIAKEARNRGAEVILVSGPTNIKPPLGVKVISVDTNEEMYNAIMEKYNDMDIVIKSAAVADYIPKNYSEEKIKKGTGSLNIELVRDKDILYDLGQKKQSQILVGFAAESKDLVENAEKKLQKKNLDFIVANNIKSSDTGFSSDYNSATVLSKYGDTFYINKMSKDEFAKNLFNLITEKR